MDCHADLARTTDFPHAEKLARVNCGTCHEATVTQYEASVHAQRREAVRLREGAQHHDVRIEPEDLYAVRDVVAGDQVAHHLEHAGDVVLGLAAISLYPLQVWLIPKLQRQVNLLGKERVRQVRRNAEKISEVAHMNRMASRVFCFTPEPRSSYGACPQSPGAFRRQNPPPPGTGEHDRLRCR